jgi:hypothetical protein
LQKSLNAGIGGFNLDKFGCGKLTGIWGELLGAASRCKEIFETSGTCLKFSDSSEEGITAVRYRSENLG